MCTSHSRTSGRPIRNPSTISEKGVKMTEANVSLIQDLYDAFSRGDIVAVLNVLDPQAELNFEAPSAIPWAGNWHGHEGWTKFFQTLSENTDEITLKMEPFAAQGDNVVSVGRYQARVKRTGNRIDTQI